MAIVVDTSVLIDHLRGEDAAREALRGATLDGERLVASVLTKVEVLAGMRTAEEDATRRLMDSLDWIEVDEDLAERAGALANRFLRSHPGIDPVDYVIAATVERLDARLWTRNVRHFPMFPELAAPY
ncbi:MAG: type II toxin-antitoxin system VapC family toxin [Chloroflexi bacterium]|nr:type II toxin-antitoxin system VapC family toxin [Chloroflexota bacterium]